MRTIQYFSILSLFIWMLSCKSDPTELLPVITLTENENKQFTFTNKISGFYIGNSHRENGGNDHGWTVNDYPYLTDYRIYTDDSQLSRDSILQFNYYPFSFKRKYKIPVTEKFTLLDSIDAIVWEFELPDDVNDFRFEPLLHDRKLWGSLSLNAKRSSIILSPLDVGNGNENLDRKWMGFNYLQKAKNKVVILCALEANQSRLNRILERLSTRFEDRIETRKFRIASLLEVNNTYTNMPEITDAVTWAQLSLDALITDQKGKGIWTGIPWFNTYCSRSNFISFTGAFMVNGKFNEAKGILESFSRFQLQNENDPLYGRIPDCISSKELTYNDADGTWWFIRDVYEYLLYSGDMIFIRRFYPVIVKAIKGAIRHQIDENFFLLHHDADTWMDITGPEGARSPRGNRAIEIQSLWYTALQIGSIFAGMNEDTLLQEHWLAISQTLKKNITDKYWSRVYDRLYDHLYENGYPDRAVRPNQIFAAFVSRLPGIEPLLTEDTYAKIVSDVVHTLTYRYGVTTLWQGDENFNPWHHNPPNSLKDESYHNGTINTWLGGPVISSMVMLNRHELAFDLFYNEAMQIIWSDAIGNFAERLDAFPQYGKTEPQIFGSISYAPSLAEFIRNFYQDFIGYRPNALENRIAFCPKIPSELRFISTQLPFTDDFISFTFTAKEDDFNFEFSIPDFHKKVEVTFEFPGFDEIKFQLSENQPSFSISLDSKKQHYFYTYQDLEWYFAQPNFIEGLNALKNKR